MAKTRIADRQRHWRKVIERQQASRQSIVGFCAQENICPASFHAWKKRFRQVSHEAGRKATDAQALLPVQVVDAAVPTVAGKLEVEWPDGVVLRSQGCEAQTIGAVVAALSASPARRARRC